MTITRYDHEKMLVGLGIVGGALDAAITALGHVRHGSRVEAAKAAALEEAGGDRIAAAAILMADACIRQTNRHPALVALGTGRRKAHDGGAWDAAIEAAARDLCYATLSRRSWAPGSDGKVFFGETDVTDLMPPWVRVQVVGVQLADAINNADAAAASAWAACYNAALDEGNLAPHHADLNGVGLLVADAAIPLEEPFIFADDDAG